MQIINRKIPKEGKSSTLIERLNDYIAPVDSEWFSKIKPADIKSIDKLKKVLGMEKAVIDLPKSFVEFAKYAGEDDGGLISRVLIGRFSISNLLNETEETIIQDKKLAMWEKEIYITEKEMCIPEEEMLLDEIDSSSPYYFEFFMNEMGLSYSIMIQDNVEKGIYQEEELICDSFEKLLFQHAVKLYENRYFNVSISFNSNIRLQENSAGIEKDITVFKLLEILSVEYGLKKAWFNANNFYFAYSDEISIYLMNDGKINGVLLGNDEKLVEKIANKLLPKINAKNTRKLLL